MVFLHDYNLLIQNHEIFICIMISIIPFFVTDIFISNDSGTVMIASGHFLCVGMRSNGEQGTYIHISDNSNINTILIIINMIQSNRNQQLIPG